jgi:hypothetical protein
MVEISMSGSGEGSGWATDRSYSTGSELASLARKPVGHGLGDVGIVSHIRR